MGKESSNDRPAGICAGDETGRILFASPALHAMFGYEPGALTGQPLSVLEARPLPDGDPRIQDIMEHLRTHEIWYGRLTVRKKSGLSFGDSCADFYIGDFRDFFLGEHFRRAY